MFTCCWLKVSWRFVRLPEMELWSEAASECAPMCIIGSVSDILTHWFRIDTVQQKFIYIYKFVHKQNTTKTTKIMHNLQNKDVEKKKETEKIKLNKNIIITFDTWKKSINIIHKSWAITKLHSLYYFIIEIVCVCVSMTS